MEVTRFSDTGNKFNNKSLREMNKKNLPKTITVNIKKTQDRVDIKMLAQLLSKELDRFHNPNTKSIN